MILNNVKSAFKVKKLHQSQEQESLATHGSHERQEKRKGIDLAQERRSKHMPTSDG